MRFFLHTLFFATLFSATFFAQTPQPTPTPIEDDDVVKISTTLIQVDATVTDSRGKVVSTLKAEDFEVFENDKKQAITNFSFISAKRKLEQKTANSSNKNQLIPVPYTQKIRPDQIRRTIALVVDDLTLSSSSMAAVRHGLRKYIKEQMLPGDLVAIIKTGGGSGALQQFTTDKQRLLAVIDRLKWNPSGLGGISAFEPIGGIPASGIPPREGVIPNLFEGT